MNITNFLLSLISKIIIRNRENFFKITAQADQIITWLVGFSFTTIALLLSIKDSSSLITSQLSHILLIFSSLTIIIGILYRIFIYSTQLIENKLLIKFEAYIEGLNNSSQIDHPRKLTDSDTCEDIIRYFKEDFKIDMSYIDVNNLQPVEKEVTKAILYRQYSNLSNSFSDHFKGEIYKTGQILKKHFGYSEQQLKKLTETTQTKYNLPTFYWVCFYSSVTLFYLTIFMFLIGFMVFFFSVL